MTPYFTDKGTRAQGERGKTENCTQLTRCKAFVLKSHTYFFQGCGGQTDQEDKENFKQIKYCMKILTSDATAGFNEELGFNCFSPYSI